MKRIIEKSCTSNTQRPPGGWLLKNQYKQVIADKKNFKTKSQSMQLCALVKARPHGTDKT